MLLLFPGFLLLGIAAALGAVRYFRRRFRYVWLGGLGAALVAWLVVLIWRFQLPLSTQLSAWGSTVALPSGMQFSADNLVWLPAWSLTCLLLAGLIVGAAQPEFQPSLSWALPPAFVGLALLAVSASDAITLVVVWSALDLAEVALTLAAKDDRASTERAVAAFAIRLSASGLAVLAQVLASGDQAASGFALLLIFAIIVRLLAQTLLVPAAGWATPRGSLGTTLRLASAMATIGFLPRLATVGEASPIGMLLAVCVAAMGLAAGTTWLRSAEPESGLPPAIAGISSLAVGSALLGNPTGAAAWIAVLALAGGALFLSGARGIRFAPALMVGAWSLSALPFSLTGAGWPGQLLAQQWPLPFFLLVQALFLAGFVQHAFRPRSRPASQDAASSFHGVFDFGIALLLAVQILLGIWGWQGAAQSQALVPGAVGTVLGLSLFAGRSWLRHKVEFPSPSMRAAARRMAALVRGLVLGLWAACGQVVAATTNLLEGQAGIMWGLLLLALFASLIVSGNP